MCDDAGLQLSGGGFEGVWKPQGNQHWRRLLASRWPRFVNRIAPKMFSIKLQLWSTVVFYFNSFQKQPPAVDEVLFFWHLLSQK